LNKIVKGGLFLSSISFTFYIFVILPDMLLYLITVEYIGMSHLKIKFKKPLRFGMAKFSAENCERSGSQL
jgi:hypothetical protein